jgi:hypothetical protein
MIGTSGNEGPVRFWRASDGNIRWLMVVGLMYFISAIVDARRYGAVSLRCLESFSFAVAWLAAAVLEEPERRGWPHRQKLRTWYGRLSAASFAAAVGLLLWRTIHDIFISQ